MREELDVIVPTLRAPLRGSWLPAEGRSTAALLINNLDPAVPAVHTLFAELELYLHTAGIASLRLSGLVGDTSQHAIDLLGGVSHLRSRGWERIVVVAAARGEVGVWETERGETLASLLAALHGRESSLPLLVAGLRDLVATIRVATESVVGVAMLLAPGSAAPSPRLTSRKHATARQHGLLTLISEEQPNPPVSLASLAPASPVDATEPEPAIYLHLPSSTTAESTTAESTTAESTTAESTTADASTTSAPLNTSGRLAILSRLYLWCRAWDAVARNEALPGAPAQRADPAEAASPRALLDGPGARTPTWEMLSWLDSQWSRLVEEAGLPELAAVPTNYRAEGSAVRVATAPSGWSLHASRGAWDLLGADTRMAWLRICHQAFTGA